MIGKECKYPKRVYKVQTFRTTQYILTTEKLISCRWDNLFLVMAASEATSSFQFWRFDRLIHLTSSQTVQPASECPQHSAAGT